MLYCAVVYKGICYIGMNMLFLFIDLIWTTLHIDFELCFHLLPLSLLSVYLKAFCAYLKKKKIFSLQDLRLYWFCQEAAQSPHKNQTRQSQRAALFIVLLSLTMLPLRDHPRFLSHQWTARVLSQVSPNSYFSFFLYHTSFFFNSKTPYPCSPWLLPLMMRFYTKLELSKN